MDGAARQSEAGHPGNSRATGLQSLFRLEADDFFIGRGIVTPVL